MYLSIHIFANIMLDRLMFARHSLVSAGTFLSGDYRMWYYIIPIDDSDDETVVVTMSEDSGNPFPDGYYFPSFYSRDTFRIIDDD